MTAQGILDAVINLFLILQGGHFGGPDIGCHNDNRIFKINNPALRIS